MSDKRTELIAELNALEGLERLKYLSDLRDYIEYGQWSEAQTRAIFDYLLRACFSQDPVHVDEHAELNWNLRYLLRMQVNFPFSFADLGLLFDILRESRDTQDTCQALSLLSYTHDRKFIGAIRERLQDPEPVIAAAAGRALERLLEWRPAWQYNILDPERIAQLGETGDLAMRLLEAMPSYLSWLLDLVVYEEQPTPISVMQTLADCIAERIDDLELEDLPAIFARIEQLLVEGPPDWQSPITDVLLEALQRHLLPREHWVHLLGPRSLASIRDEDEFFGLPPGALMPPPQSDCH